MQKTLITNSDDQLETTCINPELNKKIKKHLKTIMALFFSKSFTTTGGRLFGGRIINRVRIFFRFFLGQSGLSLKFTLFAQPFQLEVDEVPHHPGLQQRVHCQRIHAQSERIEISFGPINLVNLRLFAQAEPESEHQHNHGDESRRNKQNIPQSETEKQR